MTSAHLEDADRDLVLLALPGVQRLIRESRTTSDLRSASEIVASLASEAAMVCQSAGAKIVFPAVAADRPDGVVSAGMPNRVAARVPAGRGAEVAAQAAEAVRALWADWVRQTLGRDVDTPGLPSVVWVCAPATVGDYGTQWRQAQAALAARRRIRDFPEVAEERRSLCSLSPRWVSEDVLPAGLVEYERDVLSAANWVKRLWRPRLTAGARARGGFPSTSAISSAIFRQQVLRHVDEPGLRGAVDALRDAVERLDRVRETPVAGLATGGEPGAWFAAAAGRWVYEEIWQQEVLAREYPQASDDGTLPAVVRAGRSAAKRIVELMRDGAGIEPPTAYLALMVQDLDGMGRFLSGEEIAGRRLEVRVDTHQAVSALLSRHAAAQRQVLEGGELLGVPVYAGGDDLLAFTPAATALQAARACQGLVPAELPTASTAVLFFHHRSSLRLAVHEAHRLLKAAKEASPRKQALAVGFLRRSGTREQCIQPWLPAVPENGEPDRRTAAELLGVFAGPPAEPGGDGPPRLSLSPGLVGELERDAGELADPALDEALYRAELARLVVRHGGSVEDAEALARLGAGERGRSDTESGVPTRWPAPAARVAVFLRQECR